jgi:hypothetical protein
MQDDDELVQIIRSSRREGFPDGNYFRPGPNASNQGLLRPSTPIRADSPSSIVVDFYPRNVHTVVVLFVCRRFTFGANSLFE